MRLERRCNCVLSAAASSVPWCWLTNCIASSIRPAAARTVEARIWTVAFSGCEAARDSARVIPSSREVCDDEDAEVVDVEDVYSAKALTAARSGVSSSPDISAKTSACWPSAIRALSWRMRAGR